MINKTLYYNTWMNFINEEIVKKKKKKKKGKIKIIIS